MAVRASMAAILNRLRRMIGDRATTQVFSDEDLQESLDVNRAHVRYFRLREEGTRPPGGGFIQYRDYYADCGNWEASAELVDANYTVLPVHSTGEPTGYTADLLTGHWSFPGGVNFPVYLTGYRYDVNAAAADVLEEWAALVKLDVDRALGDEKETLSQQHKMLLAQAQTFRAKQEVTSIQMVRSDIQ